MDENSLAKDFENAIVVDSVAEEYTIIETKKCDCGGSLKVQMQSLVEHSNKHYDVLHCECDHCKNSVEFVFDINSFFGKAFK